ncbi:MAG: hypothetical protein K6C36_10470 [Clostridia bacterium]|nr:hypothetical protein [Clostridia bacterium]
MFSFTDPNREKAFLPKWFDKPAPADSVRSLFASSDDVPQTPGARLYGFFKKRFDLTDESFSSSKADYCLDRLPELPVTKLPESVLDELRAAVGPDGVSVSSADRIRAVPALTSRDVEIIRKRDFTCAPEAVIYPREPGQIKKIASVCRSHALSIAMPDFLILPEKPDVSVALSRGMKKLVSFAEKDLSVTVLAGAGAYSLEGVLNRARTVLDASHNYTLGENLPLFGNPSVGRLLADGVPEDERRFENAALFEADLRIRRFTPETRRYFCVFFRDRNSSRNAADELMCSGLNGLHLTVFDENMTGLLLSLIPSSVGSHSVYTKAALIGYVDGPSAYTRGSRKSVFEICSAFSGRPFLPAFAERLFDSRPHLAEYRDAFEDFGLHACLFRTSLPFSGSGMRQTSIMGALPDDPGLFAGSFLSFFDDGSAELNVLLCSPKYHPRELEDLI